MTTDDLQQRYRRLRQALDAAYAAALWDTRQIDRIAEQMLPLERVLAARHSTWTAPAHQRMAAQEPDPRT